jgi:transposase
MIRKSSHCIKETNIGKLSQLDAFFVAYESDLKTYVHSILSGILPLKDNLSSKVLPVHSMPSAQHRQIAYKHAAEIVRGQQELAKKKRLSFYKKLYAKAKREKRFLFFTEKKFGQLQLKDIRKTRFFSNPEVKNITIGLDERVFDIQEGIVFDRFIRIQLHSFKKGRKRFTVCVPLKFHRQSNNMKTKGFSLKKNIQLKKVDGKYFVSLVWEKEFVKKDHGTTIGIDQGVNKLIATSTGLFLGEDLKVLYVSAKNKKRGSKAYKKMLIQRTELTNRVCKQLDLSGVNQVVIEDLTNIKNNKSFKSVVKKQIGQGTFTRVNKKNIADNNSVNQSWLHRMVSNKIGMMCEENGVELVKVSPSFTSQTCSACHHVDAGSRNGAFFKCVSCGFEMDADINAAINIRSRGIYGSFDKKADRKN